MVLCLFFTEAVYARNDSASATDRSLSAYYRDCQANLGDEKALLMADTLFKMAADRGDSMMQAVALCTKLDYYYFNEGAYSSDSVAVWVSRVQQFARYTKQPEFYYFAWGSRLIADHLRHGLYNKALVEAGKMLDESMVEGYKGGIKGCYESMAGIYGMKTEWRDKTQTSDGVIATPEFSAMLDRDRLEAKNEELERLTRKKQTQNRRYITISLCVLMLIVSCFLYRQRWLLGRLKISGDELDKKSRILRKAENELSRTREIAGRKSHLKARFAQNISHEIRTPLNSIVGFSAVLADMFREPGAETTRIALLIEENSQVLLRHLGDILDLSMLEDSPDALETAPVDVNTCCRTCIRKIKPQVKKGVILSFEPGREGFFMKSNEERFAQILDSLLDNAAKFTLKGTIILAYTVEEGEVAFTVTDTGIGIPVDKHQSVFERFVKLDEFSKGTGLGLFSSLIIAKKLGGNLDMDREYTTGTRAILILPLK